MDKIKILIVDDHNLVRDGIQSLLSTAKDMWVVGEASCGEEAVSEALEKKPDLILMDIMLPDFNGIEAARRIKEKMPQVKILFLSMEVIENFVTEAVQVGADGYLPKEIGKHILLEAIRKIKDGEKYFDKKVSDVIFQNFISKTTTPPAPNWESLITGREREVLILIAQGLSHKEIAEQLFLSVKTVDSHRLHILQKLDLNNNAELVKFAIKNKLISLDD
jgi:DNA-binding NarL/FixJ family response regulator